MNNPTTSLRSSNAALISPKLSTNTAPGGLLGTAAFFLLLLLVGEVTLVVPSSLLLPLVVLVEGGL
jgi:hypothetical protein